MLLASKDQEMKSIKLHYDGWLSLPASLCQELGLSSGDHVEADLVDGAIVLRPASKSRRREPPRQPKEVAASAADAAATFTLTDDAAPAKRKPGRPRKVPIVGGPDAAPATAPKKRRGRPPKAALAPEPEPVVRATISIGSPKLLKKADLPPKAASAEPPPAPPHRIERASGEADTRVEERRPFRHVEVRKLGPGRGHNRPGQHAAGTAAHRHLRPRGGDWGRA